MKLETVIYTIILYAGTVRWHKCKDVTSHNYIMLITKCCSYKAVVTLNKLK